MNREPLEIEDAEYYEIDSYESKAPSKDDLDAAREAEDAYSASRVVQPDFLNGKDQVYEDGKPVVTKRHEILLAHYQGSAFSIKIMNAVFSQLDPSSTHLRPITMRVSDLAHLLNIKPQSINPVITNVAEELQNLKMRTDISAATLEEMLMADYDRLVLQAAKEGKPIPPKPKIPKNDHEMRHNPKSFEQYNIFSKFAYDADSKLIQIKFNQELAPILIGYLREGRGKYTYYFLEMTRDMRSNYAQRVYELCRYILTINDVKKGKNYSTRTFEYETLRGILGVPEGAYPDFTKFEHYVLKVAAKAMKDKDICFNWETIRLGGRKRGKVQDVVFTVFSNDNKLSDLPLDENHSDRWKAVLTLFTKKQQETLTTQYGLNRIQRNIERVEQMLDNEEIEIKRSKFTYVHKMIKEDSAGIQSIKNLSTSNPLEVSFIHQFLVPTWTTSNFSDHDRDKILTEGFNSTRLRNMVDEFKRFRKEMNSPDTKADRRRKITEAIFSGDTDW